MTDTVNPAGDALPTSADFDLEIDTRGLTCRASMRDFEAFARQTGNALLAQQADGGEFTHYLRRR